MIRYFIFVILLVQFSHQEELNVNKRQSTCSCGAVNRRTRIIGGQETERNEYPWMGEIRRHIPTTFGVRMMDLCGAALIDRWYLITAAHCFQNVPDRSQLRIYLGAHNLSQTTEANSVVLSVSNVTIHPNYNTTSQANDIAIVRLSSPVTYQSNIQPVCIPPSGLDLTGENVTVTGFGATEPGGPPSSTLQEVTMPVISNRDCRNMYARTVAVIDQSVICAGGNGTKDACQGDSGGPAVVACGGRYLLVGVVSYGIGCADPRYPGVFTNVSNYLSWISSNTPGSQACSSSCRLQPPGDADCGWAGSSPTRGKRVVGGLPTATNQYPWMVPVYINHPNSNGQANYTFDCAASIISKNWLITSGRCVFGVPLANIFFVVGDNNIDVLNEPGEQEVFPAQIIIHPQYNVPFLANDIAVIRLTTTLTFSKYVGPVCIPSTNAISSSFADTWAKFLGWGRTSTEGRYASQLREVNLYAITNSQCVAYYGTTILNSMVCTASSPQGDVCEGDNGGPLMLQGRSGRYYAVGVNSFRHSSGCGSGNPSGHTRISSYVDWIQQTTGVRPAATTDTLPM